MKVGFVRGKYLNNFEGQNYIFRKPDFTAISSLFPLDKNFPFKVTKLPSLADIPGRVVKYFGNRVLGDSQLLLGLESLAPNFDICHTADPHYYFSYQLAKLRMKKQIKKLLVTSWETIPFNNESVKKKKENKYFVLKQADKFICYTNRAKQVLVKEGVEEGKIAVVRLGVDLGRFRSRRVKNKTITILFVGRLVEEKGIKDLLEIFTHTEFGFGSNVKLRIVGSGPLRKEILSVVKKNYSSESISLEEKNYIEMPDVYQQADIFVLPGKRTKTWEEQYGMVLVEAMASGLPIIAYDTGAISEVIGEAGILVKENDKKVLFNSIERLIKAKDLREKLGRMGRERAEKYFDAKKTALKIENIYSRMLDSKS